MRKMAFRISHQARTDIVDILRFTEVKFGEGARRRYQGLLQTTFLSIAEEPSRVGSSARDELAPGLRSLHLFFCRLEVATDRVIRPRHIVFYRQVDDQVIEIVRILHDAMEVSLHLQHLHQT